MMWMSGLVLIVLIAIVWQDCKYRAVYWWLFLLLFAGLLFISCHQAGLEASFGRMACNASFIGLQLGLLTAYFVIKNKRWVNIFSGYLGLGDLCFLLAITAYFPLKNYLAFYIASLFIVLLLSSISQIIRPDITRKIPLAGYQSLCMIAWIIISIFCPSVAWTKLIPII